MSHLKYFSYPGQGVALGEASHYSQSVRIGDTIECSGQGGWDQQTGAIPTSIDDEMAQTFRNVDRALRDAGGEGWSQVYRVSMFYAGEKGGLDDETHAAWGRCMREWCPGHRPLLTAIGAGSLALPGMRVEVAVAAHLGGGQ